MACPLGADEINKLKFFIGVCSQQPNILNSPQLEFFKTFVEQLGGKIPDGEPNFACPNANSEKWLEFHLKLIVHAFFIKKYSCHAFISVKCTTKSTA